MHKNYSFKDLPLIASEIISSVKNKFFYENEELKYSNIEKKKSERVIF